MIKISRILVIIMLILIISPLTVEATHGYQANKNGTSLTNKSANDFFVGIRKIETEVFEKTQDAQDGIDCHMAKNTEWGAMAILATSKNGGKSTTGNESGIYKKGGVEYVSGIWEGQESNQYISEIANANQKYYDSYSEEKSKSGDATLEIIDGINSWEIGSKTFINISKPIFLRGNSSSFGFLGYNSADGSANSSYSTRIVMICGEDF